MEPLGCGNGSRTGMQGGVEQTPDMQISRSLTGDASEGEQKVARIAGRLRSCQNAAGWNSFILVRGLAGLPGRSLKGTSDPSSPTASGDCD
jgi:hypothetical protein